MYFISDCSFHSRVQPYHLRSWQNLAIDSLSYILLHSSFPKKKTFSADRFLKMVFFPNVNVAHVVGWWLWSTVPCHPWSVIQMPPVLTVAVISVCIAGFEMCSPKNLWTLCGFPKVANTDVPHFNSLLVLEDISSFRQIPSVRTVKYEWGHCNKRRCISSLCGSFVSAFILNIVL